MATPTFYLQTLSRDEAIAFVTSLQRVKNYLNQELEWITEQLKQKTTQLQGIETLLSEAVKLGLISSESQSSVDSIAAETDNSVISVPESAISETDDMNDASKNLVSGHSTITPDLNGSVAPPQATITNNSNQTPTTITPSKSASTSAKQKQDTAQKVKHDSDRSKPKPGSKSSPISKISAAKTKNKNVATRPTAVLDLRHFLRSRFNDKTFTDVVSEILDSTNTPLHLNDLITRMYDDLPDRDYKRAKASLANVLSVGRGNGRWQSLGQGVYASNNFTA